MILSQPGGRGASVALGLSKCRSRAPCGLPRRRGLPTAAAAAHAAADAAHGQALAAAGAQRDLHAGVAEPGVGRPASAAEAPRSVVRALPAPAGRCCAAPPQPGAAQQRLAAAQHRQHRLDALREGL